MARRIALGRGLLAILLIGSTAALAHAAGIGVAWYGKSGMADRVLEGFQEGMQTLAPGVPIEVQPNLADEAALTALMQDWKQSKDGVVLLRSGGATWLMKNPLAIPAFIGACNHPGQLGVVKNMDKPEGSVTGVTYFLPVDTQFDVFQALLPEMKSVLLLLEAGHPGSPVDQEATRAVCAKRGIALADRTCSSLEQVTQAIAEHQGKVNAIIAGNQALLIDHATEIVDAAGKTPVLAYNSKPATAGALGGFVADDHKLGKLLAESVVSVVVNKQPISSVPIKVDPDPKFYVNATTAQALGVEIPYSVLEIATVIEGRVAGK